MARDAIRHLEEWANPRTVVILTLLLLVALWTVVIASALAARRESIENSVQLLQRTVRGLEEQTRLHFRLLHFFLLDSTHWLQRERRELAKDLTLRERIETFRVSSGGSIDIRFVDVDGRILDEAGVADQTRGEATEYEPLKGARPAAGLYIGNVAVNPAGNRRELLVSFPLPRPVRGIASLLALVELTALTGSYEEQRPVPGGAVTLLRLDGSTLATVPESGGPLWPSTIAAEVVQRHVDHAQDSFVFIDERETGETRQLVSYSTVRDFPLLIVVSQDYEEALAPWLTQMLWVVLLAVGVTVPLVIVAWRSLRLLQAIAIRDAALHRLTTGDSLTGVSNRQHFADRLDGALRRSQTEHTPLSVLLFTIDFFRRINDGYGHAIGDQVLIAFAEAARNCLRHEDLVGRLGACEFAIMLPGTDLDDSLVVAERIRAEIARISIPSDNGTVEFTASVGATAANAADQSIDELLRRATAALHDARLEGHDHVATG